MIMHIKQPNAETEAFMDARYLRVPGTLRWVRRPGTVERLKSLAEALAGGPTDGVEASKRLGLCRECKYLQVREDRLFCGCCGCGKNRLSELRTKTKMKKARCPLKRWSA